MRDIGYDEPMPLNVRKAYAKWIRGRANWTLWTTVTFVLPVSSGKAFLLFRDALQLVSRQYGDTHFWVATAVEPHRGIDGFHVHALLDIGTGSDEDVVAIESACRQVSRLAGKLHFDRYDPEKGAPEYITKTVAPELWLVCPRAGKCARRKCQIETGGRS